MQHGPVTDAPIADARSWVERPALVLEVGVVDFARCRFVRQDRGVEALSARECAVLAFLADRPNQPVPRDDLLLEVWGHADDSLSRAVDTAVARLRKKVEPEPGAPRVLFTEHGTGYRLLVAGEPTPPPTAPAAVRRILRLVDREVDLTAGHVDGPDGRTPLTAQERLLIEELLRLRGAAVPGAKVARRVGMASEGAVRNAVYRLRAKLEVDASRPVHLLSVPGGAYRLDANLAPSHSERSAHIEALASLADYVGAVLGYSDCVVYSRDGDMLRQMKAFGPKRGPDGGVIQPLVQALGEGLVGAAAASAEPVLCVRTELDARYLADLFPARSEVAVPVLSRGHVVGVIDAESPAPHAFSSDHIITLQALATIAAPSFSRLQGGSDD